MDGIIGASLQTRLAADADIWVKFNNAIFPLVHGCDGADANARRIAAVIAASHLEMPFDIRELPDLSIFYPCAGDTQRHFIFALTGDGTRVTADTLAIINDKAKIHGFPVSCSPALILSPILMASNPTALS
jgi:hypothetical protein